MTNCKTVQAPHGWNQGDPIIVCIDTRDHMRYVQQAFNMKAYYCGPFTQLWGKKSDKIIVFTQAFMSYTERERFERWVKECVYTCLSPKGEIFFV